MGEKEGRSEEEMPQFARQLPEGAVRPRGSPEQSLLIRGNCIEQEWWPCSPWLGASGEKGTSAWILWWIPKTWRLEAVHSLHSSEQVLPWGASWVVHSCGCHTISFPHTILLWNLPSLLCSHSKCRGSLGNHFLPISYIFPTRCHLNSQFQILPSLNVNANSVC